MGEKERELLSSPLHTGWAERGRPRNIKCCVCQTTFRGSLRLRRNTFIYVTNTAPKRSNVVVRRLGGLFLWHSSVFLLFTRRLSPNFFSKHQKRISRNFFPLFQGRNDICPVRFRFVIALLDGPPTSPADKRPALMALLMDAAPKAATFQNWLEYTFFGVNTKRYGLRPKWWKRRTKSRLTRHFGKISFIPQVGTNSLIAVMQRRGFHILAAQHGLFHLLNA